jgi:hypothetical protein
MRTRAELLTLIAAGAIGAGCSSEPLGVADRSPGEMVAAAPSLASANGTMKIPISGTISQLALGAPDRQIVTPGGRCRFVGWNNYSMFQGDLTGPVTFHEQVNAPCDVSDIVASGPFDAQVTWNGRSGTIRGQWTTNCTTDPSQPVGLACAGTMNARGSGGLDGVDFHFDWGTGWFPFDFTGTAFVH